MLIAHFTPASLTTAQYDEVVRRLERAGAGAPDGRLHHAAYGPDGSIQVLEIFDTPASFAAFGQTLMPILGELGIDVGEPKVEVVHNIIAA